MRGFACGLSVLLIVVAGNCQQWERYAHTDPAFTINYPTGWQVAVHTALPDQKVGRLDFGLAARVDFQVPQQEGALMATVAVLELKKEGDVPPGVMAQEMGIRAVDCKRGTVRENPYRQFEQEQNGRQVIVTLLGAAGGRQIYMLTLTTSNKETMEQCRAGYTHMMDSLQIPLAEERPPGPVTTPRTDGDGNPLIGPCAGARWSPDGKYIVYWGPQDGAHWQVFVVGADGTGMTCLTSTKYECRDAAWAPDGSKIAFARRLDGSPGPFQVFTMSPDGSGVTRLTDAPGSLSLPQWSPDGKRLMCLQKVKPTEAGRSFNQIIAMDADGSNAMALTDAAANCSEPVWSPDGKKIAFVYRTISQSKTEERHLWVMDSNGGAKRCLVPHSQMGAVQPTWSPDGKWIAFQGQKGVGPSLGPREHNVAEIWAVGVDGTGLRNLTASPLWEEDAVWSPDGTKIAYVSHQDTQVLLVAADGSATRPLVPARWQQTQTGGRFIWEKPVLARTWAPRWAPSGKFLLVRGAKTKDYKAISGLTSRDEQGALYVLPAPAVE